jgi:hypothetical protein
MTGDRERLGEEIGDVVETADKKDTKVYSADAVPDLVQAHVSGLGHPLRDGVGSNADSHLVVAKQRGGGVGVAHVGQDFAFLCRDAGGGDKPAYSASATKEQITGMRVEWQEMG